MSLSHEVEYTLADIGQVAAEVICLIDGYREFVSVYRSPRSEVLNAENRFPYLENSKFVYRCIRFRVLAELIDQDADIGPFELIGLQEVVFPSPDCVDFLLKIWQVSQDELLPPRDTDIPV